jgi:ADP-ribose pyrophosphatase
VKHDLTNPPWRTTGAELVYAHPQLCLVEYQILRRNGRPALRHRLAEPASVRVVAVDPDGLLALVWRWRYALGYPGIELPSAPVQAGEQPVVAAQRALRQDCGLAAQRWVSTGQITAATDIAAQTVHLYRADTLHRVPALTAGDERPAFTMLYSAAVAFAANGAIDDAVTVAALLRAEQDRRQGGWKLPDAKPPRPAKTTRIS